MTAGATSQSPPPRVDAGAVPTQAGHAVPVSPTHRIFRQVQAVDAWIVARRDREQVLGAPGLNRDQRMDVAREIEALRRTHDTIKGRCAGGLHADPTPMSAPGRTAVLAHRHTWFVDKLALLLDSYGVTVLACTDNGAEALGVVVAEQPDILLAGDRLTMMTGGALLEQSRVYSPCTLLAAQASDRDPAAALRAAADIVFLRHHPPAAIADDLLTIHRATTAGAHQR